ncbi:MAG: IclR family transcriptional regulator [Haloarculaceae archaeon]
MNDAGGRPLKALETTIDVVEAVREFEGTTLADLADALPYPKSTIYYHVDTLRRHGYLVTQEGEYQIGLKFLYHGAYAKRRQSAYSIVDEKLQELSVDLSAATDFSVAENGRLIVLSQRIGGADKHKFLEGSYLYLTASSAGKSILAEMSDAQVDAIVDRWGLPRETDDTITDRDELRADLERTRERGYAVSDEELLTGLRSVSATVHDPAGDVIGSVSVSGPSYRYTMDTIEGRFADRLLQAVSDLETEISSIES